MNKQCVSLLSGIIHSNVCHRWNKLSETGLALVTSTC